MTLAAKERVVAETPAWMNLQDITRDGRLLLTVEDSRVGISGVAPDAKQERDLSWFDASRVYDISSDGKTVLFVEMSWGTPRNTAIYLRRTDGAPAIRLGDGNRPMLSPDGKWVACVLNDGPRTTLTVLPTGAGEALKSPRMGCTMSVWNGSPTGSDSCLRETKRAKQFELSFRTGLAGTRFPSRRRGCWQRGFLRTKNM